MELSSKAIKLVVGLLGRKQTLPLLEEAKEEMKVLSPDEKVDALLLLVATSAGQSALWEDLKKIAVADSPPQSVSVLTVPEKAAILVDAIAAEDPRDPPHDEDEDHHPPKKKKKKL